MAVKHDMLQDNNNQNKGNETNMTKVLGLLRLIRTNPDNLSTFCAKLVEILCQEEHPTDKEGIKQFNSAMLTYKEHLSDLCNPKSEHGQLVINECLKNLYNEMVTRPKFPSVAASIVLGLFNKNLIPNAVKWILTNEDNTQSNEAVKRVFEVLIHWVCTSTCCSQNISSWITDIVLGLYNDNRLDLLQEISFSVIEKLLKCVKIPVFRSQLLPIIRIVLISERRTPKLFHSVLYRIPDVIRSFNGNQLGDREIELLITINSLMTTFPDSNQYYREIEQIINLLGELRLKDDQSDSLLTSASSASLGSSCNPRVGLVNLGNTCYMNSVLQALVMTKEFSREILLSTLSPSTRSELIFHIQKLLAQLLHSKRPELTPREVLHAARPPGFLPGHQQDSSEFLGHLLDTLHEQELNVRRKRQRREQEEVMMEVDEDYEEEKNGQTLIQRTFGGAISITYQCLSCGETSTNKDSFRDIPLAFPDKADGSVEEGSFYVQNLLDYYCSSEKLEGDNKYFCEKCEKLCDGQRSINFVAPPRNLILTLKHFKYDQQCHTRAKLMHSVYHDESITLKVIPGSVVTTNKSKNSDKASSSNATTSPSSSSTPSNGDQLIKPIKYNLYAAVVHSGMSMDAGHYYTYASDKPDSWYKFNDNFVTRCSIQDLHRLRPPNSPYILFYRMADLSKSNTNTLEDNQTVALPQLDELPLHLRDFILNDNFSYCQEMKDEAGNGVVRFKKRQDDDPDDREPPNSCGGNAIDHSTSYIC